MIIIVRNSDNRIIAGFDEDEVPEGFDFPDCTVYPKPEGLDDGPYAFYDGTTLSEDLTAQKSNKWTAIKDEREVRRMVAPTTYGDFDVDEVGRSNILGMLQAIDYLDTGVAEPITWKMHDNSFVDFTRLEFKDAALQALAYIRQVYSISFILEAQIDAATSIEDLETIEWPEE